VSAPAPPEDPRAMRCPSCGAEVRGDQDWCLECGVPARTRLAPTPRWRVPLAVVASVIALAGAALAIAFVALTDDPADPLPGTATTAVPPVAGTEAPTPAPPAVTAPEAEPVPGAPETPEPPPTEVPGQDTPGAPQAPPEPPDGPGGAEAP
jgi:hypothetical protein